jgi:hypothetical protein
MSKEEGRAGPIVAKTSPVAVELVKGQEYYFCACGRSELMKLMARACGHDHLSGFCLDDISTWHLDLSRLAGIPYSGDPPRTEGR